MRFEEFTVGLLVRRREAPFAEGPEADRLQDAHLAHLAKLHEDGHLLAAGPFVGGPDPATRGLAIFRESPEEVERFAEADPLVQAGQLTYRCFSWTVPAGAVRFSPAVFPRSTAEV